MEDAKKLKVLNRTKTNLSLQLNPQYSGTQLMDLNKSKRRKACKPVNILIHAGVIVDLVQMSKLTVNEIQSSADYITMVRLGRIELMRTSPSKVLKETPKEEVLKEEVSKEMSKAEVPKEETITPRKRGRAKTKNKRT